MAKAAEHREVVAGTAADLENLGARGGPNLAADEVRDDFAPGAVPPVPVVELGHLPVDRTLHQRNTSWRLSTKVASGVMVTAGTSGHQVGP